ncbi:MAG TPA: hypothetical protein VFO46_17785 [Candidatus Sulfotelmatobacter sp.]|nr:hypothetical protein [Candidatus Sulfotelmatobacter sp.]
MAEDRPSKIVYLFGAGATHAELQNLAPVLAEEQGLLVSHVSSRVIERARREPGYIKDVDTVSDTSGSLNIELLISLIENSKIRGWEHKTRRLKDLVKRDIESVLTAPRTSRFYLHKALFELHEHQAIRKKEELTGLISLNYDNVLDSAYKEYYGRPRYCFSLDTDQAVMAGIPLLKLHGSFSWKNQTIRGRQRTIEIIPLGSTKNYIHPPYGCIWNQAFETLVGCDTLRVIGCSLSPNDFHLIDLLFKAHLERGKAFELEIIASDKVGDDIRRTYGFFPGISSLTEIKGILIPETAPANPFKAWLRYRSLALLDAKEISQTRYIKRIVR